MQSIIQQLQEAFAETPALFIGYLLVALLALQFLLIVFGSLRRIYWERRQFQLSNERLQLQIKTALLKCQEAEQSKLVWNGYRKFTVAKKVSECEDVYSFYLAPHDGKALPPFRPGQYLTFQLNIPGSAKPVIRCYSLSDGPNHPDRYRVTIKKALPPCDQPQAAPGLASTYFCDRLKEGDILDVKAPGGHFCLDLANEKPVVLISGGVGITPMLSMLNAIIESGSKREVWFFFGARSRADHIQKEHLEQVAAKNDNVHLQICYSRPASNDRVGIDYHHAERVSVDLLKRLLPSSNYDFFICGPGPFMKSITDGLKEWGVPDQNVFFEAFGPATVKRAAPAAPVESGAPALEVNFSRSGKVLRWKPDLGSLLDLAEASGIAIESGCRAGNCGTCLVAIKSGNVEYLTGHGAASEEGSCLTCICRPKSNLVLDA